MVPAVIVNVMRGGPGLGNIQASQGDYFQGVKGGGNGDYHLLTYAPASIQEFIDIMMFAYDKAEKYRIPVLFLADGIIAQMMEPVELPEMVDYKVDPEEKPWACTGWKPGDDPEKARHHQLHLHRHRDASPSTTTSCRPCTSRSRPTSRCVEDLQLRGRRVHHHRLRHRGPYRQERHCRAEGQGHQRGAGPSHHRVALPLRRRPPRPPDQDSVKAVLDVELNEGQMLEDVKLARQRRQAH